MMGNDVDVYGFLGRLGYWVWLSLYGLRFGWSGYRCILHEY
jgi:hypothetical protein